MGEKQPSLGYSQSDGETQVLPLEGPRMSGDTPPPPSGSSQSSGRDGVPALS